MVPCVEGVDGGASSNWFELVPEPDVVDALLAGAGAATARYPVSPAAASALPHNAALRARAAG
jgi:hypothetical protein